MVTLPNCQITHPLVPPIPDVLLLSSKTDQDLSFAHEFLIVKEGLCFLRSQHSQSVPQQGRPVGVQQQKADRSAELPPQGSGYPGDTGVSAFPSGNSIPTSQPQAETPRPLQVGSRTSLVLVRERPKQPFSKGHCICYIWLGVGSGGWGGCGVCAAGRSL